MASPWFTKNDSGELHHSIAKKQGTSGNLILDGVALRAVHTPASTALDSVVLVRQVQVPVSVDMMSQQVNRLLSLPESHRSTAVSTRGCGDAGTGGGAMGGRWGGDGDLMFVVKKVELRGV